MGPLVAHWWFGALGGAAYGTFLIVASAWDIRRRRIPNLLVLAMAVGGLAFSLAALPWPEGVTRALLGAVVGLVLWLPPYALGALGAGDVKFFAAASAWIGPSLAWRAALVAAVAGGVLALGWMLWRRRGGRARVASAPGLKTGDDEGIPDRHEQLPYGVAMAVGLAVAAWFPDLLL